MFKHDCSKHGHRFEARYSQELSDLFRNGFTAERISPEKLKKILFCQKYVYDVCVKCGKIIKPVN